MSASLFKSITCVIPKRTSLEMVERLKNEHGVIRADKHYARGFGAATTRIQKGRPEPVEKDVLTVVVTAEEADTVFDLMYGLAEVDQPHGGFLYMGPVTAASNFALPDIEHEELAPQP